MEAIGWTLLLLPLVFGFYAYAAYPLLLKVAALSRSGAHPLPEEPETWPNITVTIPAYNEADVIRGTLEALIAADYPKDRTRIVVVSDASDDGTDQIVREFEGAGVELHRLAERRGKTAAENAALAVLDDGITVNMDASIRVPPGSLKALVRALQDPTVGVASGRDVSVYPGEEDVNRAESGYVDYEMWLRSLETRVGSIVGASGCFYAIRTPLHKKPLPPGLSRDFAAALTAREEGYRSVSVDEAVCLVPRTRSLRGEFRRKVRTMARGLSTLFHKKHLLNPLRFGSFSFMLFSHKLCRWLVSLVAPFGFLGALLLAWLWWGAAGSLVVGASVAAAVAFAVTDRGRDVLSRLSAARYLVYTVGAGGLAWIEVLRGTQYATWEPTQRENVGSPPSAASGDAPPEKGRSQ